MILSTLGPVQKHRAASTDTHLYPKGEPEKS